MPGVRYSGKEQKAIKNEKSISSVASGETPGGKKITKADDCSDGFLLFLFPVSSRNLSRPKAGYY
jgi:hypothetical protein